MCPYPKEQMSLAKRRLLNLSLACSVDLYASTTLISVWLEHSQMKPTFNHLLLV
jgi:hypothetical protein